MGNPEKTSVNPLIFSDITEEIYATFRSISSIAIEAMESGKVEWMNTGYISGYACNAYGEPVEGAIVKLKSLKIGKRRIKIYDPDTFKSKRTHSDVSKSDGSFVVPFAWNGLSIAEVKCDPVFRLIASHRDDRSLGYASEKFYVRQSVPALLESLALGDPPGNLAESSLQSLADTWKASAPNIEMVGFGGCEVILNKVFSLNIFRRKIRRPTIIKNQTQ